MNTFLKTLETDLDWRVAELASLRRVAISSRKSSVEQRGLLRACWAILYAHYEGFFKFAVTIYFDCLSNSGVKRIHLDDKQLSKSLEAEIARWRSMPRDSLVSEILSFPTSHLHAKPSFLEVNTQSNLWPNLIQEILADCGIKLNSLVKHERKLNTLVSRRNEIAHGKKNFIDEVDYYLVYEQAVLEVVYEICFELDQELSRIIGTLTPPPSPVPPSPRRAASLP